MTNFPNETRLTREQVLELQRRSLEEMRSNQKIQLDLPVSTAMILIANVQLAGRHPGNTGPSALIAREFTRDLAAALPPASRVLARLGEDPAYDEPPEEAPGWHEARWLFGF